MGVVINLSKAIHKKLEELMDKREALYKRRKFFHDQDCLTEVRIIDKLLEPIQTKFYRLYRNTHEIDDKAAGRSQKRKDYKDVPYKNGTVYHFK